LQTIANKKDQSITDVRTGVQRGFINLLPQIRAFGRVRSPGRLQQRKVIMFTVGVMIGLGIALSAWLDRENPELAKGTSGNSTQRNAASAIVQGLF
jgi:hypothetical protein